MNSHTDEAYWARGRVYSRAEELADRWAYRQMLHLAQHDSRLAQPAKLGGYFGARLSRRFKVVNNWTPDNAWEGHVMERIKWYRCYKTGAQFTAGDILTKLGLRSYCNPYGWLRRASEGLGIDYTDSAGRRHKLYTWGDLPILAERLNRLPLRRKDDTPKPAPDLVGSFPFDELPDPGEIAPPPELGVEDAIPF